MSDSEPLPAVALPVETGRQIAHPWLCDANGHLNTRHIQGFYDDATQHLLALCGFSGAGTGRLSIADVRCTMSFAAEIAPGAPVMIRSGFAKLGGKSFTTVHALSGMDGTHHGGCETTTVFFDLDARRASTIPNAFREAATRFLVPRADDEARRQ